jgi:PilZ domain
MGNRAKRRQAQRFRVALPVELVDGTAVTRDFSTCGVFFKTSQTCVPGECLEFTVVLEHVDPGHLLRLRCQGRVVRVEPHSTRVGVAVAITAYRIDSGTDTDRESQGGESEA